ncbi:hypothetical protein BY996DRAFT_8196459, partial [Phakopsora pachyrhizi]
DPCWSTICHSLESALREKSYKAFFKHGRPTENVKSNYCNKFIPNFPPKNHDFFLNNLDPISQGFTHHIDKDSNRELKNQLQKQTSTVPILSTEAFIEETCIKSLQSDLTSNNKQAPIGFPGEGNLDKQENTYKEIFDLEKNNKSFIDDFDKQLSQSEYFDCLNLEQQNDGNSYFAEGSKKRILFSPLKKLILLILIIGSVHDQIKIGATSLIIQNHIRNLIETESDSLWINELLTTDGLMSMEVKSSLPHLKKKKKKKCIESVDIISKASVELLLTTLENLIRRENLFLTNEYFDGIFNKFKNGFTKNNSIEKLFAPYYQIIQSHMKSNNQKAFNINIENTAEFFSKKNFKGIDDFSNTSLNHILFQIKEGHGINIQTILNKIFQKNQDGINDKFHKSQEDALEIFNQIFFRVEFNKNKYESMFLSKSIADRLPNESDHLFYQIVNRISKYYYHHYYNTNYLKAPYWEQRCPKLFQSITSLPMQRLFWNFIRDVVFFIMKSS